MRAELAIVAVILCTLELTAAPLFDLARSA
jgi:hypothetical protein